MIPIYLKQTKPFSWQTAMQQVIRARFGGEDVVQSYLLDIQHLNAARQHAVMSFKADLIAMETIKDYIQLLNTVEARIPGVRKDYDGAVRFGDFSWSDTFGGPKDWCSRYDLQYERHCMLFNLAVLEYQLARGEAFKETLESAQSARTGFLRAAAIFDYLAKNKLKGPNQPLDLEDESLTLLLNLSYAQAHEAFSIIIAQQPSETVGARSMAKVSSQSCRLLDSSLLLARSSALVKRVDVGWMAMLEFQKLRVETICAYFTSEVIFQKAQTSGQGFGERVAWLKRAESIGHTAWDLARKKGVPEDIFKPLQRWYDQVQTALNVAASENSSIYMQPIPNPSVLALIEGHSLQALPIEERLMATIPDDRFLANLIVPWAKVAEETFKARLRTMVKSSRDRLNSKLVEVKQALHEAGLPNAINGTVGDNIGSNVPDAAWKRITEVVHARGGVAHLKADAGDNQELNDLLSKKLKDLQVNLNTERDTDEDFRSRLGSAYLLPASRDLNSLMYQDIMEYRSLLVKAKQKDDQILLQLRESAGYLELLTRTREQLSKFIPSVAEALSVENPRVETARREVNLAYQQFEIKSRECDGILGELVEAEETATIIPDLTKDSSDVSMVSEYVQSGLARFENGILAEVETKLSSIQALFSLLLEKNYAHQSLRTQSALMQRREQALKSLDLAVSKFQDMTSTIREGHRFYVDLRTHIDQLEKVINDFCYVRNSARND